MTHALGGQSRESRIKLGSHVQRVVVIFEQLRRLLSLLWRIESSRRKFIRMQCAAGHRPVNFFHRSVVYDPGSHPAIESHRHKSIFLVSIAGRERLELMQGMQITDGPGNECDE